MAITPGFPFRWVLPSAELLLCLALLWPVRQFLFFGVLESIQSYSNPTAKNEVSSDSKPGNAVVPPPTEQQQRIAEWRLWETLKVGPLALNFPVLVAELPYIIVSPSKEEWVPRGMFRDTWRALSWPLVGVFFWWFLGRSFEGLFAARRLIAIPRISWAETTFALILCVVGIIALIGIVTSTPDDRRDIKFMALTTGGVFWGLLATTTIAARYLQWRLAKRSVQPIG